MIFKYVEGFGFAENDRLFVPICFVPIVGVQWHNSCNLVRLRSEKPIGNIDCINLYTNITVQTKPKLAQNN